LATKSENVSFSSFIHFALSGVYKLLSKLCFRRSFKQYYSTKQFSVATCHMCQQNFIFALCEPVQTAYNPMFTSE